MFPYDANILAAIQTPPTNVAGVVSTLQAIDALCIDTDGLKWFNWLYLQVTLAVEARIAQGGFTDPQWLAELDVQFAKLYFVALQASLTGGKPAGCWRALFQVRSRQSLARVQFALSGVNAHINHDLPEAIVATCLATHTVPQTGGALYRDYTGVNTTLDAMVETAKKSLRIRLLGDVLPPAAQLEDTLAAWSMSAARESAWISATHLWQIRSMPVMSAAFMNVIDGFTTVIGKTLLVPVPPNPVIG